LKVNPFEELFKKDCLPTPLTFNKTNGIMGAKFE